MKPVEGRKRVVIEEVQPRVSCGRYPAKRTLGDGVTVTAAIFGDGHDHVAGRLLFRHESESDWHSTPMIALTNDMWTATFTVDRLGTWNYTIEAWVDHFGTWCSDLQKRLAAQHDLAADSVTGSQNIPLALRTGAALLEEVKTRAKGGDAKLLDQTLSSLRSVADQNTDLYEYPGCDKMIDLVNRYPDLAVITRYHQDLPLWVDRERARYSTWYELFPRSTSPDPNRHGTFADVEALLPDISAMGFDVLYLPPIHPIGNAFRKGPNNNVASTKGDSGSPWASARMRVVTPRFIASLARSRTSSAWSPRHTCTAWRLRSISPSSVRPTIPGLASIPTGSSSVRTAPSNTPKIRPKSIRISIR